MMLLASTNKKRKKHLDNLNSESLKVGLETHKEKTEYISNYADSEDTLTDQEKLEKSDRIQIPRTIQYV